MKTSWTRQESDTALAKSVVRDFILAFCKEPRTFAEIESHLKANASNLPHIAPGSYLRERLNRYMAKKLLRRLRYKNLYRFFVLSWRPWENLSIDCPVERAVAADALEQNMSPIADMVRFAMIYSL